MRYEAMIGLRYLRARRKEAFISLITVISVVGVMIGVMTLNIVLAVMTGFEEDLRDRILGFNPHIVVISYAGAIRDADMVLAKVRDTPGVVAAAPLVYSQVMLTTGQSVSGVVVRGVPAADDAAIVDLKGHLTSGSIDRLGTDFEVSVTPGDEGPSEKAADKAQGAEKAKGGERPGFTPGRDAHREAKPSGGEKQTPEKEMPERQTKTTLSGVIIGQELAKQLGVQVGDPVSMVSPIGTPSPVGMIPKVKRFAVAGTFDSGMFDYDSSLIYMSLADAQRFFGLGTAITGVEIRVADIYRAQDVAHRIEARLGTPFRARDWMDVNRNLFLAFKLEKVVYFIVLLLIVLVAAFNIIATLIMVVMEKRKDIAILKCMGATNRSIARIFMLKGAIVGTVGTLLGVAGGYAGCWLLARYQFVELPKDVFYVSTLPVRVYGENFLVVALASVTICLLATIYPARQAAGLAPVEVIRYE
ncbi:MAG: ABC transporter permease [Deltaproteobacteria bacterium]|nr:ABC transporter permease [Deltaproteobacteria bacterium]